MPHILLQPIIFLFKESETGGELRQLLTFKVENS